jgi:hypothetical protein
MTLDLRSLPDLHAPTLTSADAVTQGEALRRLLSPIVAYLGNRLSCAIPITLRVLNPTDWAEAVPDFACEYSLYDAEEASVYVPATYAPAIIDQFEPPAASVPADATCALLDRYTTISAALVTLSRCGALLPTRWLAKFCATYLALCAEQAAHPDDIARWSQWATRWATIDTSAAPEQFSLAAYEFLGTDMGWSNYFWFQAAFVRRALALLAAHGDTLIQPLVTLFPPDGPAATWTTGEALAATPRALEQITPGWLAWAAQV